MSQEFFFQSRHVSGHYDHMSQELFFSHGISVVVMVTVTFISVKLSLSFEVFVVGITIGFECFVL